jgi:hypothetical protein
MTNLLAFVWHSPNFVMNAMDYLLDLISGTMCLRSWIVYVFFPQLMTI